jgi:hypothetical protein
MTTLIATYVVAWVGISAYAARLVVGNRRLFRRLNELEGKIKLSSRDLVGAQAAA